LKHFIDTTTARSAATSLIDLLARRRKAIAVFVFAMFAIVAGSFTTQATPRLDAHIPDRECHLVLAKSKTHRVDLNLQEVELADRTPNVGQQIPSSSRVGPNRAGG